MTLLPNERVIPLAIQAITLTTHRIRLLDVGSGHFVATSIMLEELASCAATKTELPVLLYLAIIVAALGILVSVFAVGVGPGPTVLGILVGAVLFMLYLATRKTALAFASGGGARIVVSTGHMDRTVIVDVIDTIEQAKDERARNLAAGQSARTVAARGTGAVDAPRGRNASVQPAPAVSHARTNRGLTFYFYTDAAGEVAGPVTIGELKRLFEEGVVASDTQVCAEGTEHWQPIENLTRF